MAGTYGSARMRQQSVKWWRSHRNMYPMGPPRCLTAVADGNVSGRVPHEPAGRRRRWAQGLAEVEGVAQEVDGLALEAQADVA